MSSTRPELLTTDGLNRGENPKTRGGESLLCVGGGYPESRQAKEPVKLGRIAIRRLEDAMKRENRQGGFFVRSDCSSAAKEEAVGFY